MTELGAVKKALTEWRRRANGKRKENICALCEYADDQGIECSSACPVYKGTDRTCEFPGEPYHDWIHAMGEEKLEPARRAVALLEATRDRILKEQK